jgi:hypothetical protein
MSRRPIDQEELETTIPWHKDEYMIVDGMEVVYTVNSQGEFSVKLPGGGVSTVEILRARGRQVELPKLIRAWR